MSDRVAPVAEVDAIYEPQAYFGQVFRVRIIAVNGDEALIVYVDSGHDTYKAGALRWVPLKDLRA
jgi:hypothetical protein